MLVLDDFECDRDCNCDWLRSSRVLIASGFSPRDLIAYKRKAPEERGRFGNSDCVVQIYPTLRLGFIGLVIHSQPEPRGASRGCFPCVLRHAPAAIALRLTKSTPPHATGQPPLSGLSHNRSFCHTFAVSLRGQALYYGGRRGKEISPRRCEAHSHQQCDRRLTHHKTGLHNERPNEFDGTVSLILKDSDEEHHGVFLDDCLRGRINPESWLNLPCESVG